MSFDLLTLQVTLGTDDPLQFHTANHAQQQEYVPQCRTAGRATLMSAPYQLTAAPRVMWPHARCLLIKLGQVRRGSEDVGPQRAGHVRGSFPPPPTWDMTAAHAGRETVANTQPCAAHNVGCSLLPFYCFTAPRLARPQIARNSVLVSGFPDAFKRKWLGPNYHISSNFLWANDPNRCVGALGRRTCGCGGVARLVLSLLNTLALHCLFHSGYFNMPSSVLSLAFRAGAPFVLEINARVRPSLVFFFQG